MTQVTITEPVNLHDLVNGGTEFTVIPKDDVNESDIEEIQRVKEASQKYLNFECLNIKDDDTYVEGTPFELIAKKMMNLLPSGKIKKRILLEGDGEKPLTLSTVKIHYNAYIEYEIEPFDSSYARNEPRTFIIDNGDVIVGLNLVVQSMRLYEKAQFLIDPEYAYRGGCLGRIPANSIILFEVELLEVINSGDAILYEKLSEEKQKEFEEICKYASALLVKAKVLFKDGDLKGAIKEYNLASTKMENVILNSREEQDTHANILLRLYTNLLVSYTKMDEPRKACKNAEKIYELAKTNNIKISAKIYFNHAKCYRLLGDYDNAKLFLKKANELEENNPDIANEFLALENDKIQQRNKEKALGKALLNIK